MIKQYINPHNKLMNCLSCGRDTKRKSGYCYRCISHYGFPEGKGQIHDVKDRTRISNSELDYGAFEELYDGTLSEDY